MDKTLSCGSVTGDKVHGAWEITHDPNQEPILARPMLREGERERKREAEGERQRGDKQRQRDRERGRQIYIETEVAPLRWCFYLQ